MSSRGRLCITFLAITAVLGTTLGTTSDSSARVAHVAASPLLNVAAVGGVVVSADGRIHCPPHCSAAYPLGALVTLSPTEPFSSHWIKGCVGTAPQCLVGISGPISVRARLARKPVNVGVGVSGFGTVVSSPAGLACGIANGPCSAKFGEGSTVTLIPYGAPGVSLGAWRGPCSSAGTGPCKVLVGATTEVTAAFPHALVAARNSTAAVDHTLTVNLANGSISSSPPGINCPPVCSAPFPEGSIVVLSGAGDYEWGGDCHGSTASCAVFLDADDFVTAGQFVTTGLVCCGVNITVSGHGLVTGGKIRCSGTTGTVFGCQTMVPPNETVVLRAKASHHHRLLRWSGGYCRGRRLKCTVLVEDAVNLEAVFR